MVTVQQPAQALVTVQPAQQPPTVVVQPSGPPGPPGTPAAQEITGVREGQPPAGAILFWYEFGQATVLDADSCRMRVGIAPAADYPCPVTTNGVTVGSWLVAAGTTQGVLSLSQLDYAQYDDLQVTAPLVPDANLNDTLIIMALEA